jgi:hypothetical protein
MSSYTLWQPGVLSSPGGWSVMETAAKGSISSLVIALEKRRWWKGEVLMDRGSSRPLGTSIPRWGPWALDFSVAGLPVSKALHPCPLQTDRLHAPGTGFCPSEHNSVLWHIHRFQGLSWGHLWGRLSGRFYRLSVTHQKCLGPEVFCVWIF